MMRMDEIAHEITFHYLRTTERVIHAVDEESKKIVVLNEDGDRYFIYFDPLDGSSNVNRSLPVGFMLASRRILTAIVADGMDANREVPIRMVLPKENGWGPSFNSVNRAAQLQKVGKDMTMKYG